MEYSLEPAFPGGELSAQAWMRRPVTYALVAVVIALQLYHHGDLSEVFVGVLIANFLLFPLLAYLLVRFNSDPSGLDRKLLYFDAACFGFWAAWLNFPALITVLLLTAAAHPLLVLIGGRGLLVGLTGFAMSALAADGIHTHDLSAIEVAAVEALAAAALFFLVSKVSWDQRRRETLLTTEQAVLRSAVEKAADEIEEAHQTSLEREQFLNLLTHELSHPLGVMKLELFKSDISAKAHERLSLAVNDMTEIVDRVVLMNKIEQYGVNSSESEFDVVTLVREVVSNSLQDCRVAIQSEVESYVIRSDRFVVSKILRNLCSNAEKYSKRCSKIYVLISVETSSSAARQLRIAVENEVEEAGIPDSDKLFTKYYRGPNAGRHSGSGLGLAIVRHLADAVGASISYELKGRESVSFSLVFEQ